MAVLSTDGASVFVSSTIKEFFRRWGIRHRVSSAYYPRSKKWVEVGVKFAKRLITASPAQIIFGRNLKDHLPGQHIQYQT